MQQKRLPFPLLSDLRGQSFGALRHDAIAGLTTAVMLIPQGMAYALLAGLPPVVGLYAALVPPIGYALFGSSRELSVGPVAMDSLLVLSTLTTLSQVPAANYPAAAALLALCVGGLQVLMGVLRLGYLVNFLSQPVLSGFTSAAAILIALSQVKHLLGIGGASGDTLLKSILSIAVHIHEVKGETLVVSLLLVGFLLVQKRHWPRAPGALLALLVATLLASLPETRGRIELVGQVPAGLPAFLLPRGDLALMQKLIPSALLIATVSFMESIAVGRVYAKKGKYPLYADRELWSLGVANMLGSLFQGYPVAGGFSRTAVNAQAGARSSMATLVASGTVALALTWLTPLFAHIPKAALAAIVITAVAGLVDYREVRSRFRVQKSDGALLVLTFGATAVLGIVMGLMVGMFASIAWVVVRTTRPHMAVLGRVPGTLHFKNVKRYAGLITYDDVLIVRMDAQLYFANMQFLRDQLQVLEAAQKAPLSAVILDASPINQLDSSAAELLEELEAEYRERGVCFYIAGVKGPVRDVLERAGLWTKLKHTIRCVTVHEALEIHQNDRREPLRPIRGLEPSPSI